MSAAVIAACSGDDGGSTVDAPPPIDAPVCMPVDDGNECTTDECVAGQPAHTPRTGMTCGTAGTCSSTGTCVEPSCTDGTMNGTETGVDCGGSCAPARTCDTGAGCTVAGDCTSGVCSGTPMTCQAPSCGDGVMQAGEMCDDGNNTNGDGCDDGAGDACRPTGCGNGVTTGTEACDDGNATNGDGCDNNCTVTGCGNGVTTGTETCDDGDMMDGDGCSAACAPEAGYTCTAAVPSVCSATCGDGIIAVGAETCDQGMGNQTPGDGCSAACAIETGWACTGAVSTCAPICGDGMIIAPEVCDDSNTTNLDGCSATCRNELSEVEPNEDGTPATGGSGIAGNDFDTATAPAVSVAATNANTQGAILVSGGSVNRLGAISVGAAPGTGGDEDAWAITNDTAAPVELSVDVWNRATGFGLGVACGTSIDTGLNIRSAQGAVLASNDDRNGAADRCSGVTLVLAANTTVYAHVVDFGDTDVIPGYGLQVQFRAIVCGDLRQVPGLEECDDGNLIANDGCSATCLAEGTAEVEPNEDGTPATGGSGIAGNDFDVGGMLAINNAAAQGVYDVATGNRNWLASLSVGAAPGTAGDEDVFAVTNTGTGAFEVQADTWDPSLGRGRPCVVDTGLNVRDTAGVVLTSNDQIPTGGNCSRVTFVVAPGQTRYVHVVEFGDNSVVPRYVLEITRRAVVCGDNNQVVGAEECDDGNTAANDGCSATCTVEGLSELEPNEDGTPATGGTGIGGNDFVAASAATVVTNATAQGVTNVGTAGRTVYRAALQVGAAPGTAGDEDVFAVTNSGTSNMLVTAQTWDLATGIGRACPTAADTGLNVRDAGAVVLVSNDNRGAGDSCSRVQFIIAAGQTRYLHVTEFGDNAVIARYALQIDSIVAPFQPITLACTDMTAATALATPPDDDEGVSANTALPFPVTMFGSNMISFSASANGVMQLFTTASGTSTATFSNPTTVPSTSTPNGWLAPFWDDLDVAVLSTLTTGTAPNRVFTVQWSATIFNVAGTNVRFQTQFVENGPIEFHYCSATGDAARTTGSSATVGVENAAGTVGFASSINTANGVTPGTTALRWNIP